MNQNVVTGAQILWPAFLVAGLLEMIVFAWVDPSAVYFGDWHPEEKTVYSLMFLIFWALVSLASTLSHWLATHPDPAQSES